MSIHVQTRGHVQGHDAVQLDDGGIQGSSQSPGESDFAQRGLAVSSPDHRLLANTVRIAQVQLALERSARVRHIQALLSEQAQRSTAHAAAEPRLGRSQRLFLRQVVAH